MSPKHLSTRVVADRVGWVQKMIDTIQTLPVNDPEAFFADPRNPLACESCLRRALEALFDLGRHILLKQFAQAVEEYEQVGSALAAHGVLSPQEARLFRILAGYRNRMVHFYHEVGLEEIREICDTQLVDLQTILEVLKAWVRNNQEPLS